MALSVVLCLRRPEPLLPTQETQGQVAGASRKDQLNKGHIQGTHFVSVGSNLPFLLRDTGKSRGNFGPSQPFLTKSILAAWLRETPFACQAAPSGTSGSLVATDKQSRPNKTTKALKVNLSLEQQPRKVGQDPCAKTIQGDGLLKIKDLMLISPYVSDV